MSEASPPGLFARLKAGLAKSAASLTGGISALLTKRRLDEDTVRQLENALVGADLGAGLSKRLAGAIASGRHDKEITEGELRLLLADEISKILKPAAQPFAIGSARPFIVLVAGVNGTGKTTTIGKLAARLSRENFKLVLAAGDTFRAAAIEQLKIWGERTGATVVSGKQGADAAGLAYDAVLQAKAIGADVVLIDTAGRLQNKTGLMAELEKIARVIKKIDDTAPHAVLLVLDATTGQNALSQVEAFGQVVRPTGLIMTKLDGTAKGGILVALADRFKLPIHYIGVGEGADDLQDFDADTFAKALTGA